MDNAGFLSGLKNLRGKKIVLILAAAGLLLLIAGFLLPGVKKTVGDDVTVSLSSYSELLSERVKRLCLAVGGIDEAEVLLTLDNGVEYVYAKNGASDYGGAYLVVDSGSGESAVRLTEIFPVVRGVAVVCTDGDTAAVRDRLTRLISAALGISAARVEVAGGG